MRRHFLRTGRVLAVALGCALVPWAKTMSQDEGGSDGGQNRLHCPINDEAVGFIDGALRCVKEGDHERAVDLLRSVIDRDHDSRRANQLIPVYEPGVKTEHARRFMGVTEKATAALRALPKEARELFRKKYDRRAQAMFTAALESADPVRELLKTYQRFPIATCSAALLETAADRSFAGGDLDRSRRLYERLLRDHKDELKSPPSVREKLLLACVALGRKVDVERLLSAITAEDRNVKLHLNGVARTRDEISALTLKHEALIRGDAAESKPSLLQPRGDSANRSTFGRALRLGTQRFRPKSFEDSIDLSEGRGFRRFDRSLEPGPARFLPVIWNDSIFVATADKVRAFAFDGTERPRITPLGQPYSDDNTNVQFTAAIEHGVLMAPFVDRVQDDQSFRGIPIKVRIPMRKLGGFDLDRWRWRWNHRDLLMGTPLANASFPVSPVCESGDAFVSAFMIQGFVHSYAVSFDSGTGAVRWSTWIASGQVEQTMFGEHAREPLCVPVAVSDGQVFNATQMGCIASMDADTGRLRWVTEYDQIEVRSAKGYYPDPRNIGWENNAPVVESAEYRTGDGKVEWRPVLVVTPMDSDYYYGVNAQTGEILWKYPRAPFEANVELRYLFGAADGRVVLAGGKRIVCRDLASGRLAWKVDLSGRHVAGRGVIAAGKVYVPTGDTIEVVNLTSGAVEGSMPTTLTGNLAVVGDSIVITSDNQVGAFQNLKSDKNEKSASKGRDF